MAAYDPTQVLTDPDSLSAVISTDASPQSPGVGDEVFIDTVARTVLLRVTGNLSKDGVTLKCLYSFLKERWKNDSVLIKFPFPMTPITDEQFEFYNSWNLDKVTTTGSELQTSPQLIRTGGWAVKHPSTGNDTERWCSVISLGSLGASDQVYFQQIDSTATDNTTNFKLTGAVNQAVQFYRDDNGDNDTGDASEYNYSQFLKLFNRTWQKTYASASLSDIGVTTLTYQAYRFPVVNATDSKLVALAVSEAAASGNVWTNAVASWATQVANVNLVGHGFVAGDQLNVAGFTPAGYNNAGAPVTVTSIVPNYFTYALAADPGGAGTGGNISGYKYDNMSVTWYANGQPQTGFNLPSTAYFEVVIEADVANNIAPNPVAEEIYAFVQAQLRRAININDGDGTGGSLNGGKVGKVVPEKLRFVGDDLYTLGQTTQSEGVFINDYNDADINRLHFWGYGGNIGNVSVVNAASWTGGTVRFMTSDPHEFYNGNYVTVSSVTPTAYNGTYQITVTNAVSFTSSLGSDPGAFTSAGSVVVAEYQNIQYPYTAVLTLSFGDNLVTDADSIYAVFFTNDDAGNNAGFDYGTANATVVSKKDGSLMTGNIGGNTAIQLQFDYDNNTQRGGGAGVDAPITVVAIGLSTAQYVRATGAIEKSISNSVSLVAPLERNYQNPA